MGIFRTILALAVVLYHSGGIFGYDMTGGRASVECFYIISGFYMSVILNEKYRNGNLLYAFYSNRLLRLMPVYYSLLALKIILSFVFYLYKLFPYQTYTLQYFINFYEKMNMSTILFLIASNLLVFGQDICLFLGFDIQSGNLYFGINKDRAIPLVWFFNFLPHAWTLSIELCFYLIAPLIVRRRTVILIMLLLLSLSVRIYCYFLGFRSIWWTYAFFPFEMALFITGSLSYKLYRYILLNNTYNFKSFQIIAPILIAVTTFLYPLLPKTRSIRYFFDDNQLIYYCIVAISIPFLFILSKNIKFDRLIGELSYPIYLSHLIIIPFFGAPTVSDKSWTDILLIIILSIFLSIAILKIIIFPIEKYRQARIFHYKSPYDIASKS